MKALQSLDPKDRKMLLIVLGLVAVLLVVLAVVTPTQNPDDDPIPDSYLSAQHGAKAGYTLLEQSGYNIERWEQPLSELAVHASPETVLVTAEPYSWTKQDKYAIASILDKGGRVLATGYQGGLLLPRTNVIPSKQVAFAACEAQPDGVTPLASGVPHAGAANSIWILPRSTWTEDDPAVRTAYTCAGAPVVVEYAVGKGHIVWWADATPLENGSISRGQNLELLLNSVGPAPGHHIYWDESLHGKQHTQWDFVSGPVWPLLFWGGVGLALLVIFSYSRRSGPVRPLPQAPRSTPIEFIDALGSLYRSTGASATALQIAWERFRAQASLLTGLRNPKAEARELAASIERRYGAAGKAMEADLIEVEDLCWEDSLKPSRALALIQTLRRHEETLRAASTRKSVLTPAEPPASVGVTLGS
jgi:hypothetical protein